jgi:hypothetical protein
VAVPSAAEAADVDLAQVSKKALASPAGARAGTIGKGMMIRADHSFANDDPFRCFVSSVISPSRSVALTPSSFQLYILHVRCCSNLLVFWCFIPADCTVLSNPAVFFSLAGLL